jgi:hypothetical protein
MSSTPVRAEINSSDLLVLAREQETEHAIILLDTQRRLVAWCGGSSKMFGYSVDAMRARRWTAFSRLRTVKEASSKTSTPQHLRTVARTMIGG